MSQVFISFVHEDASAAAAVQNLIQEELALKDQVFLSADKEQVYAGELWLQKIHSALDAAKVLVLMFSRRSLNRAWVNFEAGGAWIAKKPIIPCCYGGLRKDALPHPYSAIQALNLVDEPHYLLNSVHYHLRLTTPKPSSPFWRHFAEMVKTADESTTDSAWTRLLNDLGDPYKRLASELKSFVDEPERRRLPQ